MQRRPIYPQGSYYPRAQLSTQYHPYPDHLHPSGKRRKIELSIEDKKFMKSFEEKVSSRRKYQAKLTVTQTLQKLGEVYKLLEKCKENLNSVDIARKLEESQKTVSTVCTVQNMERLKKLTSQRKWKKENLTQSREQRDAKIAALASEIDHWRAAMLAQDKKKNQDEELKSTAGNTLQQVLQKQKQTKRLLDTVKLLVELREIRKQQASRREGQFIDPEVDQRFDTNVSKIKDVIKEKLETFYAEEKTIKVLMEANEADIWGVEKKLRQLEHIPDNVIDYSSVYQEIQYNPRKLVEIRRKWDEYLTPPGAPSSTRIPTTRLVPPAHPNTYWAQYLRSDQNTPPAPPPPPPPEPVK